MGRARRPPAEQRHRLSPAASLPHQAELEAQVQLTPFPVSVSTQCSAWDSPPACSAQYLTLLQQYVAPQSQQKVARGFLVVFWCLLLLPLLVPSSPLLQGSSVMGCPA